MTSYGNLTPVADLSNVTRKKSNSIEQHLWPANANHTCHSLGCSPSKALQLDGFADILLHVCLSLCVIESLRQVALESRTSFATSYHVRQIILISLTFLPVQLIIVLTHTVVVRF